MRKAIRFECERRVNDFLGGGAREKPRMDSNEDESSFPGPFGPFKSFDFPDHGQISSSAQYQDSGRGRKCQIEAARASDDDAGDDRRNDASKIPNEILNPGPFPRRSGSSQSLSNGPHVGREETESDAGRDEKNHGDGVVGDEAGGQ